MNLELILGKVIAELDEQEVDFAITEDGQMYYRTDEDARIAKRIFTSYIKSISHEIYIISPVSVDMRNIELHLDKDTATDYTGFFNDMNDDDHKVKLTKHIVKD